MFLKQICSITILLLFVCGVGSEFYTTTTDFREHLRVHNKMANLLKEYITKEKDKLDTLYRFTEIFSDGFNVLNDDDFFVANPITAYLLTKRFTTDWKKVESLLKTHTEQDYLQKLSEIKNDLKMPSEDDVTEAAFTLAHLQSTYNLDISDLVKGKINGVKYSSALTASECFELAQQYSKLEDHQSCLLWINETEALLKNGNEFTVDWLQFLELHAHTEYKLGNFRSAQNLNNKLLSLQPLHEVALKMRQDIEIAILEDYEKNKDFLTPEDLTNYTLYSSKNVGFKRKFEDEDILHYHKLCRGEVEPLTDMQLSCSYRHMGHPFLRIGPFKAEELFRDPQIDMFYDVFSNTDIGIIKQAAEPLFETATVIMDGIRVSSLTRVSQSCFLDGTEAGAAPLQLLSKRLHYITGLVEESGEDFQIAHYGIGGQYEPHFDFLEEDDVYNFFNGRGNRLATVLIYMSDVIQGGATVFPNINVTVWPKKGAAVVWENLLSNDEGNEQTLHGGCPVLVGSKWVSNKWYHTAGNEFRGNEN